MKIEPLKIVLLLLFFNFIAIQVWLTSQSQTIGVDSWYWIKVSGFSVPLANITIVAVLLAVLVSFFVSSPNRKNSLVLAVVFFSSAFIVRLLEFELDDIAFVLLAVIFAVFLKEKAWLVGIGLVAFYIIVHGFYTFDFWNQQVFAETRVDFVKVLHLIPALYIFAVNGRYKEIILIVSLFLLFPIPKFVGSALSILTYCLFFGMTDKKIRYEWIILTMLALANIVYLWEIAVFYVDSNQDAVQRLCDEATRICGNAGTDDIWFGHYLSAIGYKPTNFPANLT